MPTVEVCLTPAGYAGRVTREAHVAVVVDVLRATTAMVAAFDAGIAEIVPLKSVEEAQQYKQAGWLVAAEREGEKLGFADLSNSPFEYASGNWQGISIAYTTTNGSQAILTPVDSPVFIAAFTNAGSVAAELLRLQRPVVIIASGWKGNFSLEDTVCAGYLVANLNGFTATGAYTGTAKDLYDEFKVNLAGMLAQSSHGRRLANLGLDDVFPFAAGLNTSQSVPVYRDGKIRLAEQLF